MNPKTQDIPRFDGFPEHVLEKYLCGELTETEQRAVEHAAENNPALSNYLQGRREEQDAFRALHTFAPIRAKLDESSSRRTKGPLSLRSLVLGAPILALTVLGIFLLPPEDPEIRVRGGVKAKLIVKRSENIFEHTPGRPLEPGDMFRIQIEDPIGGYAYVFGVTERGEISTYYGGLGSGGLRLRAGVATLPESLEVDDSMGREALYVLLAPQSHDATALLRSLADAPRTGTFPPPVQWPHDVRSTVIMIEKHLP